jgi:hypothetical protein
MRRLTDTTARPRVLAAAQFENPAPCPHCGWPSSVRATQGQFGEAELTAPDSPSLKQELEVPFDRPSLEVRMGKLVPIAPQATVTTGILAALTIAPHSTLGRF